VIQARGAGFVVEYQLPTEELLQWSGWRKASEDMMNHSRAGIPLGALVEKYERKVHHFYTWLIDYLHEARKAELEEFWTKHYAWADYCRAHGIPITDEEMHRFVENDAK
jgi:hypothetical protein